MLLEVLTPDNLLYKGNVTEVILPGVEGSFGILESHAPMISALKAGECKIKQITDGDSYLDEVSGELKHDLAKQPEFSFDIKGGVVEIKENKVIVLAD